MKRYNLLLATLCFAATAWAQQPWELNPRKADLSAGRIYRTESMPYHLRSDADGCKVEQSNHRIAFAPKLTQPAGSQQQIDYAVEIPFAWTDGVVFLHLESVGSAYSLYLNEVLVAEIEEGLTPSDFHLTPLIKQGVNRFSIHLRPSHTPAINPQPTVVRKPFSGSYLSYQDKRSIRDFSVALVPDSLHREAILEVKIVAQNTFNYDEEVEVGYDIYSPEGKLLDFNIRTIPLPGRSTDTVRFSPYIYHAYDHRWLPDPKRVPPTYKVMLFTRRNGTYKEYMPLTIGFGRTELIDGKIVRFDETVELHKADYNASVDRKSTLTEIKALKAQGINTLCPSYPQPMWFYDLCTEQGMYVIDCPAIAAPDRRDDRTVGGTPSNDPKLLDEYLERTKAMYYRTRNQSCVIGYTLGAPSGNGYNMYKAYEWLKSVEPFRPVIYEDAAGEWNSDL